MILILKTKGVVLSDFVQLSFFSFLFCKNQTIILGCGEGCGFLSKFTGHDYKALSRAIVAEIDDLCNSLSKPKKGPLPHSNTP